MPQHRKRGNPHRLPKSRKRRQLRPPPGALQRVPVPSSPPCAPASAVRPVEPLERARLTLHEADPVTGDEETLSSLFYEYYRGYTIYSTARGRCCIHGTQGCLKLRGKFACFSGVEEARTLIKRLRAEGYTSADSVERSLPPEDYVWLNCWRPPRQRRAARLVQPAS